MRSKLAGKSFDHPERARGDSRADPDSDSARGDIAELRRALRRHPCHGCPDREQHARVAERYFRLQKEAAERRAADRRPVARDRAHVRQGLRRARRARLPRRRLGHRRRQAAAAAVLRARPASGRVPAARLLGGPEPGRAGGLRLRAVVRVQAGERRRPGAAAQGPGRRRAVRDEPYLGGPRPAGKAQRPVVPARAGPGLRVGGVPLGPRRQARRRPRLGPRPDPRRLRPLGKAAHRPPRPDSRRGPELPAPADPPERHPPGDRAPRRPNPRRPGTQRPPSLNPTWPPATATWRRPPTRPSTPSAAASSPTPPSRTNHPRGFPLLAVWPTTPTDPHLWPTPPIWHPARLGAAPCSHFSPYSHSSP